MGDVFRMAREYSFVAPDSVLMHGLWQQSFGSLWIVGRILLTLYRWPLVGGLLVALLLTASTWLTAYCLRLRPESRWHLLACIPAVTWMSWVAWRGLNLYYQREPGIAFGVLFLGIVVLALDAFIIWTFKKPHPQPLSQGRGECMPQQSPFSLYLSLFIFVLLTLSPFFITHLRHPYLRPVTKMEVQMLREDWRGMVETAQANASLSYRPLAAYYAIALVQTGQLTDKLFEIRLDYDSLYVKNWSGNADIGTTYYLADCDFHAGLFRAAAHTAMEQLTMNGPSLHDLKLLTRLALLDHDWALARKYLTILRRTPFEGDFVERYSAMVGDSTSVAADPVFARVRLTEPVTDSFESFYQSPVFLGYTAVLTAGRSMQALQQSLMANLYSKRMPDFLMRCEALVGTTPPRSIAEGLVTQTTKNPAIMQAFPQLQMNVQMFRSFLQNVQPYMKDRAHAGRELFDQYHGYYPYYYFFGNLKATKKGYTSLSSSSSGVN